MSKARVTSVKINSVGGRTIKDESPEILMPFLIKSDVSYDTERVAIRFPDNLLIYFTTTGAYYGFDHFDVVSYKYKFLRYLTTDEYVQINGPKQV
jgi:hypothetical protein